MGKYFVIDAIFTALVQHYGWDNETYLAHATTGKSDSIIGGSTIQNYKYHLGFILYYMFYKLSSKMLSIFEKKWKHRGMIIIANYSMFRQK